MSDIDPSTPEEMRDTPDQRPTTDKTKRPRGRGRPHKKSATEPVGASEAGGTGDEPEESSGQESDSMERAERIVQEWTVRAEKVGAEIGHQVVKFLARAREEAEDILAEAQEIRHRQVEQENDQHPGDQP